MNKSVLFLIFMLIDSIISASSRISCDDILDCSGNGFCRVDYSCLCDPHYYGDNCESRINANDKMDISAYTFTVIGGLLIIPVGYILFDKIWDYYENRETAAAVLTVTTTNTNTRTSIELATTTTTQTATKASSTTI